MSVVTHQQLGEVGPSESQPVLVPWRWRYNFPLVALWALILLALVLVRANRNWQAWLILLPLAAVALLCQMIVRLLGVSASAAEAFTSFTFSLAGAWAIVWLLGDWLAHRRAGTAFCSALAIMLIVGGLYYLANFGGVYAEDLAMWSIVYGICSLTLPLAMILTSRACRAVYYPRQFMTRLLMWSVVVSVLAMPLFAIPLAVAVPTEAVEILLVCVVFLGGITGGMIYLMNLPFIWLANRSPFYRERFRSVLGLLPVASAAPAGRPLVAVGEAG